MCHGKQKDASLSGVGFEDYFIVYPSQLINFREMDDLDMKQHKSYPL